MSATRDAVNNEVRERLSMELDVIRETGFSAYFLIVWDLIKAARSTGFASGPGGAAQRVRW